LICDSFIHHFEWFERYLILIAGDRIALVNIVSPKQKYRIKNLQFLNKKEKISKFTFSSFISVKIVIKNIAEYCTKVIQKQLSPFMTIHEFII
jgi:hypothetical protein